MPPERDVVPQAPPIPYLPADPTRVTAGDVERMIESRISMFWINHQEAAKVALTAEKKKNLYKTAVVGVSGFVFGVGTMMLISRFKRGGAGAAATANRPNIVAMK